MRISIFQVDQDKPQVVSKTGGFTVLLSVSVVHLSRVAPVGLRYLIDSGLDWLGDMGDLQRILALLPKGTY